MMEIRRALRAFLEDKVVPCDEYTLAGDTANTA